MLNVPIVQQESIQENTLKLSLLENIEYRQIIQTFHWKESFEIEILIHKNEEDGMFWIQIKNIPFYSKQIIVFINNKPIYSSKDIISFPSSPITISSQDLKNTLFEDVNTIGVGINAKTPINGHNSKPNTPLRWNRISELNIKIEKNNITNKDFFIDESGLIIENYNSMSFKQTKWKLIVKNNKSKIKIIPKELNVGKHNVEMFTIQNISKTQPPFILPNWIEGLNISSSSKKHQTLFVKSTNLEDIKKGIVGHILFDENTYYDFNDEKTYSGIGVNSKKGYIIPYKFKGDLIPILNININSVKNIRIGFSNPIQDAYFDKDSGLIKLKIIESIKLYDDNFEFQNIIFNSNFANIISGNLSLDDIIKLGKNDN